MGIWSNFIDLMSFGKIADPEQEAKRQDLKRTREEFLNNPPQELVDGLLDSVRANVAHKKRMAQAEMDAEYLPLRAQNAYMESAINLAELEVEARRIQNTRLREEVNSIIATNRITEGQARLLHKVVLELNFEAIEPSQAFELIRQVVLKVKDDANLLLEEKKALEALERAKADTRKAHAEARREEAQADLDEYVRDKTTKR